VAMIKEGSLNRTADRQNQSELGSYPEPGMKFRRKRAVVQVVQKGVIAGGWKGVWFSNVGFDGKEGALSKEKKVDGVRA